MVGILAAIPKMSGTVIDSLFVAFFFTKTKEILVAMIKKIVMIIATKTPRFAVLLCTLINRFIISEGAQVTVVTMFGLNCSLATWIVLVVMELMLLLSD
jgi:hypothetical protein